MQPKIKTIILVWALTTFLMGSGCGVNRAATTKDPKADLTRIRTFRVIKNPDEQGTSTLIEAKLKRMGFTVVEAAGPNSPVDALITYRDGWSWDMSTFMYELTVIMREPETQYPIASANSLHTYPQKSTNEMVDEVVGNLFKKGK